MSQACSCKQADRVQMNRKRGRPFFQKDIFIRRGILIRMGELQDLECRKTANTYAMGGRIRWSGKPSSSPEMTRGCSKRKEKSVEYACSFIGINHTEKVGSLSSEEAGCAFFWLSSACLSFWLKKHFPLHCITGWSRFTHNSETMKS